MKNEKIKFVKASIILMFALPGCMLTEEEETVTQSGNLTNFPCVVPDATLPHIYVDIYGVDLTETCDVLETGESCICKLMDLGYLNGTCLTRAYSVSAFDCKVNASKAFRMCCVAFKQGIADPVHNECRSYPESTFPATSPSSSMTTATTLPVTSLSDAVTNTNNMSDPMNPTNQSSPDTDSNLAIGVGVSVVVLFIPGIAVLIWYMCCYRRRHSSSKHGYKGGSNNPDRDSSDSDDSLQASHDARPKASNDDTKGLPFVKSDGLHQVPSAVGTKGPQTVQIDGPGHRAHRAMAQPSSSSQQAQSTTTTEERTSLQRLRRRILRQPVEETTTPDKDLKDFPTRTAGPFIHHLTAENVENVFPHQQSFVDIVEPPLKMDQIKLEKINHTKRESPQSSPAKLYSASNGACKESVQPKLSILKKLECKKDLLSRHMEAMYHREVITEVLPNTAIVQESMHKMSKDIPLGVKECPLDTTTVLQQHMAKLNQGTGTESIQEATVSDKVVEGDSITTALPCKQSKECSKEPIQPKNHSKQDAETFNSGRKNMLTSFTQVAVCVSPNGGGFTVTIAIRHCLKYRWRICDKDSRYWLVEVVVSFQLSPQQHCCMESSWPGSMPWDPILCYPVVSLLWCAVHVLTTLFIMYILATCLRHSWQHAAELIIVTQAFHLINQRALIIY